MATKKKKKGSGKQQAGYTPGQLIVIGVSVMAVVLIAVVVLLSIGKPDDEPSIGVLDDGPVLVATANGMEIYRHEVEAVQQQIMMQTGQLIMEEAALEQAITMKLLLYEAEVRGHTATREEVLLRLEMMGVSEEEVREEIGMFGMDYDDFLDEQVEQLILTGLVEELGEGVLVSEEAARQLYEEQVAPYDDVSFEEIRDDIIEFLTDQEAIQKLQLLASGLYENADIEYFG